MGNFMALRLYGEKKMKFNQGKALKALQPAQEDRVTEWSKQGVCSGITTLWIKDRKSFKRHTPEEMTARGQSAHYLYKRAFKTDENGVGLTENLKIDALLRHEKVTVRDFDLRNLAATAQLEDHVAIWLRDDLHRPRGALVSVKLQSKTRDGGHAIGFFQSSQTLELFDSNCGWYEVYCGKEKDFVRVWCICMNNPGWKVTFDGLIVV